MRRIWLAKYEAIDHRCDRTRWAAAESPASRRQASLVKDYHSRATATHRRRPRQPATKSQSKRRILTHHQVSGNALPLPHLLEKECGASPDALFAQVARPVRLHVSRVFRTSLATDNDPIDATPKPGPQIERL